MHTERTLFDGAPAVPEGFLYQSDFMSVGEERSLVNAIGGIAFGPVVMRGVTARRRILQFGLNYRFDRSPLAAGGELPDFLLPLRDRAASLAGVGSDELAETLVTEYPPGAPIGWHRDAPPFGIIVGISLLSSCHFKLREIANPRHVITIDLEPRSAYVMSGSARSQWQHSIPAVKTLRYSITFRTLKSRQTGRRT